MIKTIQYCYILKFTTFAIAGETKEKEVLRLRKYQNFKRVDKLNTKK